MTLSEPEDDSSPKIGLLLSVTERVKITSAGEHPSGFETISRERARAISALCPQRWNDDGFSKSCWKNGSIAFNTWASKGEVPT